MAHNGSLRVTRQRARASTGSAVKALSVGLVMLCGVFPTDLVAEQSRGRRVAVTFDDLPGSTVTEEQRCNATKLLSVSKRLLAPFRKNEWPTTGFVTEGNLCDELDEAVLDTVLEEWVAAGAELGNHTYSHPDLNDLSVEDYIQDIVRGERALNRVLKAHGLTLRYFRYPMLHAGDEPQKKAAIESFLRERGYSQGVVTMDNQEWVYAAVYERALERGDDALMSKVVQGYLRHLEESLAYYESLSINRFGRNIPHVLLLHVNALNADHIDKVLGLLRDRGYVFESLESVLRDEVYDRDDLYVGRVGLSWLHRWFEDGPEESTNEPRESEEMGRLLRSYPRQQ